MSKKIYFTVDDAPCARFREVIDYLSARNVPALFFNIGEHMEAYPAEHIYGIERGYMMANHAYSHVRASRHDVSFYKEEILRTEEILNVHYAKAGVKRTKRYFRFPYMDRGMGGGYFVEPDQMGAYENGFFLPMAVEGLGNDFETPSANLVNKKNELQKFLLEQGFDRFPSDLITLSAYQETEMAQAIDVLGTVSTRDWAIRDKHRGQWGVSSLEDLYAHLDQQIFQNDYDGAHIVFAHARDEDVETFFALVDYFLKNDVEFLDFT